MSLPWKYHGRANWLSSNSNSNESDPHQATVVNAAVFMRFPLQPKTGNGKLALLAGGNQNSPIEVEGAAVI